MATKTFEELKQLAIQIRDEKTNKANTATRIGTQMIEHLNKLEQEYYNKDGVAEQLKTRDDELARLDKMTTEYNVSVLHPTSGSGGSNKYTLETAIAQVPSKYRSIGIKCAFINSNGKPECWEYQGSSWNTANFIQSGASGVNGVKEAIADLANKQGIYNLDVNVPLGSGYYTATTARAAVPTSVRKLGLIITYKTDATTSATEQFVGSAISAWTTDANWKNVGSEGGNKILTWNTDAATTRKQVKQSDRKSLLQISYKNEDGNVINEQYIGTLLTDTDWGKDSNWERMATEKDVEFVKDAIFDNSIGDKIISEKKFEGYYLASGSNNKLVSHSDFNVEVFNVSEFSAIKIIGQVYGQIGVYAFFEDINCTTLVQAGNINSTGGVLDVDVVTDVPNGGNYLALSKPNKKTLEAYQVEKDKINRIDEAIKESQLAIETSKSLKNEIYTDIDTVQELSATKDGYFLSTSGSISANSNYEIDTYSVSPGGSYKIIGTSFGSVAGAVAFENDSLENPIMVYAKNSQVSEFSVNEKILIPSNSNTLAVTVSKSRIANKIKLYTYEENANNRIDLLEKEVFVDNIKKVICGGDSLSAGKYPSYLQSLLGNSYKVINAGVGGENSVTIAGRLGGLPMLLKEKIEITPDNNFAEVHLINSYDKQCGPLGQGDGFVNPCYINGMEFRLATMASSGDYKLIAQSPVEKSIIIPAKTPLVTSLMRENPYMLSLWMGTNKGYDDGEDLANQYQSIVDYYGVSKYIIIGLHGIITPEELKPIEDVMLKRFGGKFINWREYVCTQAIYDAGIEPTEKDTQAMSEGKCPPSLLRDTIHLTDKGYELLANLVYKRMKDLRYCE